MDAKERALAGAIGGFGGTFVLSGLRWALASMGAVFTTAPEQVIGRLEELGLLKSWSPAARRALTAAAHLAYGTGIGTSLGLLRREQGDLAEEVMVGSALGILAWGVNWSSVLPLTGVHRPPWRERTPKVLLPVLDHVVYGAVWGLMYRALRRKPV